MSKKKVNKVNSINLAEIKNPKFLQDLSYDELNLLASDIRNEIISAVSKNGGHLSSNLGIVEITIALHRMFDLSKDKLIFDVGHQCYTHKILTGRSLTNLRKQNGVSGFQKMSESVYDCYEAGHSSTSISAANGFAIARDLDHKDFNVIAVCGDGAIASGLATEGLNNAARGNHKIIIILNDNGMSISKPVGGLSKFFANISTSKSYNAAKGNYSKIMHSTKVGEWFYNGTAAIKNWIKRILVNPSIFTKLGFAYIGPIDGHNIKEIEKALKRAQNTKKSVVIHACTFKGKGYKLAEEDQIGYWHGVGPFDIQTGKQLSKHDDKISWSDAFEKLTRVEMLEHKEAVLISPGTLVGASLEKLKEELPERIFDVGIAEEHAVTLASSLSLSNHHPILSIYSTFLQRAYDEISHDLARMNCDATILVDRAGLVGDDGETHQGIYDEGYLSSIPNTIVTMPSNLDEAKLLFDESFKNHGPFFIRLTKSYLDKQDKINKVNSEFGKWITLKKDSSELVIIGVGPALRELEKQIEKENIKCTLINAIYINPIDKNALDGILNAKKIVIYDPYSTRKGLVDSIMAYLLEKNFKGSISPYFIPNDFVKQGTIEQQLSRFNLTVSDVIQNLKK